MATFYQPGVYDNIEIVGQGFSKSSAKNTPYFFLTIRPGEYDRDIRWYLPDGKEDAVERLLDGLARLGLPMDDLQRWSQLDPRSSSHVSFVGYLVTVECGMDVYNNKEMERWQPVFSGKKAEALEIAEVRKIDALFGKALKKSKPTSTKPAVKKSEAPPETANRATTPNQKADAAQKEQGEPGEEDEIPF